MAKEVKAKQLIDSDYPSFADARAKFSITLSEMIKNKDFTPSRFAYFINSTLGKDIITPTEVYSWLEGKTLPNLYQLFKLSCVMSMPLDDMFFSRPKTFAESITTNPFITTNIPSSKETFTMSTVTISRNTKKQYEQVVAEHTTSSRANILLTNKIYTSGMTLNAIAKKVGTSTRSLRDYALYGTTIPSSVANKLVKLFKTSHRNLGLTYNQERDRFEHMSVKVKA